MHKLHVTLLHYQNAEKVNIINMQLSYLPFGVKSLCITGDVNELACYKINGEFISPAPDVTTQTEQNIQKAPSGREAKSPITQTD